MGPMGIKADEGWMLLLFIAADFAVAGVGSRLGERRPGAAVWYASLRRPRHYPAAWVFAPIWSLVGLSTGIAGWLIWRQGQAGAPATALVFYGLQLLFQAVWQGVVIGSRRLGGGVALGLLLWGTITLTAWEAARSPGGAWWWLLPYWLWTGYCVRLNYELWRLNPAPEPPEVPALS